MMKVKATMTKMVTTGVMMGRRRGKGGMTKVTRGSQCLPCSQTRRLWICIFVQNATGARSPGRTRYCAERRFQTMEPVGPSRSIS
jgi:hypothetical protein